MAEYKLTMRYNLIESHSGLMPERILCINTKQWCLKELKKQLHDIHRVFELLGLTIEIAELKQVEDDLYTQQIFVNHNHGNETHATFYVEPYKK